MIPELWAARQRVNNSFELASVLPTDEEISSHWARYLCVLSSGLVELGIRQILSEYSRRQSSEEVARFADSRIRYLMNLNTEKIRDVLSCFSPEWRTAFDAYVTDEQKDAIDSIVANRNNIVHGNPVGISFVVVKRYYERAWQVLEWLHKLVLQA